MQNSPDLISKVSLCSKEFQYFLSVSERHEEFIMFKEPLQVPQHRWEGILTPSKTFK